MFMSLNSLDSKISPQRRHSTNSASSSRETICTRGCLHCSMLVLFSGNCGGGIGVINPGAAPILGSGRKIAGNVGHFSPAHMLVKSHLGTPVGIWMQNARWVFVLRGDLSALESIGIPNFRPNWSEKPNPFSPNCLP